MAKGGPMTMPRTVLTERCSNLPIPHQHQKLLYSSAMGLSSVEGDATGSAGWLSGAVPQYDQDHVPSSKRGSNSRNRLLPNCPRNQVAAGAGAQSHWLRSETGVRGVVRLPSI